MHVFGRITRFSAHNGGKKPLPARPGFSHLDPPGFLPIRMSTFMTVNVTAVDDPIVNAAAAAHAPPASAPPSAAPRPMSRARVWLVYAVLFAIVGGHLVEIVTQREHWP